MPEDNQKYGWSFKRHPKEDQDLGSFAPRIEEDGAAVVSEGGAYGTYIDLDGSARSEAELVTRYRGMAAQPECDNAISDIVDEAIVDDQDEEIVSIVLDEIDSGKLRKSISDAWDDVVELLDFKSRAYEIFRNWYIDGRMYYHAIIDTKAPTKGIQELRYIDPRKIRKVRKVKKKPVRQGQNVVEISQSAEEYYIYNDRGFAPRKGGQYTGMDAAGSTTQGLKIHKDSIVLATSGLLDESNRLVLSHLHKAIKPLNQLRVLEDAAVIYRLSRAPERRIFYIDVGNLPKLKAEQHLRDMMAKHKNRLVYDATSGAIRDDRKFMTMLEDFWLPRRDGKGTEITTLPGGANLGEMDDVLYFQKRLYRSLNVPISRLEPDQGFAIGRASEISRDEVKYQKFIRRLHLRFIQLFFKILEKQLRLKKVITGDAEEWRQIRNQIKFRFATDNHFAELKELEILKERLDMLSVIEPYIGRYFSHEHVRKKILRHTDEDIKMMDAQIAQEPDPVPRGDDGIPLDDNDYVQKPGENGASGDKPKVKGSANTNSTSQKSVSNPKPKAEELGYEDDLEFLTPDTIVEEVEDDDEPDELDRAMIDFFRQMTSDNERTK